jgi:hypothetical protein
MVEIMMEIVIIIRSSYERRQDDKGWLQRFTHEAVALVEADKGYE